ncbi:MAG: hypothetical protein E7047_06725 [Lentisphaerae bacterium]|nr:hypothetical protein [Lentisphaerota bacterium]
MDEMKIKLFVAKKLQEGVKLTEIQNLLASELGCKMTFLDLRLLAAELEDVDWSQFDPQEKKSDDEAAEAAAESVPDAAPAAAGDGTTAVEISRLARPGAMMHGTVTFASGASAEWIIDNMGQLGLDKVQGQPTQDDLMAFQTELRKMLQQH